MKVFCFIGRHNYRLKTRILNDKQECVQTIYICRKCGKLKKYNYDKEGLKNKI